MPVTTLLTYSKTIRNINRVYWKTCPATMWPAVSTISMKWPIFNFWMIPPHSQTATFFHTRSRPQYYHLWKKVVNFHQKFQFFWLFHPTLHILTNIYSLILLLQNIFHQHPCSVAHNSITSDNSPTPFTSTPSAPTFHYLMGLCHHAFDTPRGLTSQL